MARPGFVEEHGDVRTGRDPPAESVSQDLKDGCCTRAKVVATAKKYNLAIAFAVAISIALAWPAPGVACGTKHGGVRPFTTLCIV